MTKIIIGSNADNLEAAQAAITIEAEYGDRVVEGTQYTSAHHGPRGNNPAPCVDQGLDRLADENTTIGLSHFDLDSLMGVGRALGRKYPDSFAQLAAFVDTKGPHKLGQAGASEEDLARLHAFWAWSAQNRLFPPRDGSVQDVTEFIAAALNVMDSILVDDPELLKAGREFKGKEDTLNRSSLNHNGPIFQNVLLRSTLQEFVNHLYTVPGGATYKAVVSYNRKTGAVTCSLADPIEGVNCGEFVKSLWGDEAGGHTGIGGSPRNKPLPWMEAIRAAEKLDKLLA
jgi:hypothetical protein